MFYSNYCYGELSILFLFVLLQDTPEWVHLLLLYIDTRQIFNFIMFYFKVSQCFAYIKSIESVPLWYFEHNFNLQKKKSPTFQFRIIHNVV